MAVILQAAGGNSFAWIKIDAFWFIFRWCVPKGLVDSKSSLVQKMPSRNRIGDKPWNEFTDAYIRKPNGLIVPQQTGTNLANMNTKLVNIKKAMFEAWYRHLSYCRQNGLIFA